MNTNKTEAYPFIFMNHGELCLDYVNKNTECYIWFEREVTAVERKIIVKSCPPPLSGLFVWGECFAYFGSGGDTFDFDIVETYAGKKVCAKLNKMLHDEEFDEEETEEYKPYLDDRSGSFPEIKLKSIDFSDFESAFADLLEVCVPRMSDELEKWTLEIHKKVPLVFLKGPHGSDEDDEWNKWSYENLDTALNSIVNYIEINPGAVYGDISNSAKVDESMESLIDSEVNSYSIQLLPPTERFRYFSYIFEGVLLKICQQNEGKTLLPEERRKRLKLADMIYNLDGISSKFDRLSLEEHAIQVNDDIILSALYGLKAKERLEELAKLEPYTQLAYYASYGALKAGDILLHENPAFILNELAASVPAGRQNAITSILSMIAHNLVHVTPAYTKQDKTHAKEASAIFELISKRPNAEEKDFITGTVCCEWAKNNKLGTIIAEDGLKKFPKSKQLVHNAISVNNLSGNPERAKQLLVIYETLMDKPDENYILNKSFNLIKSNQFREAADLIENYIELGGKKSPNILVNLLYTWSNNQMPEKPVLDAYVIEIIGLVKNNSDYQADGLLENFLGLTSSKGYYKETIELGDYLHKKNGNIPPNCWVNYTYAAYFLDAAYDVKVATKMDMLMPKFENHIGQNPVTFANLACIHLKLNNKEQAISYLKLCKKHNHPKFATFITDEDYRPLWKEKQFLELFDQ